MQTAGFYELAHPVSMIISEMTAFGFAFEFSSG
jgi:hypothetical protein